MTRQRWVLAGVGATAFVWGLADVAVVLLSDGRPLRGVYAALTLVIGWSFVGTGLYAWSQRPDNRIGLLMTAVGLSWFLNPLEFSDNQFLFVIGGVFGELPLALLGHMLLAFPDGRLHSRAERRVVAAGYFTATVLELPAYFFYQTENADQCHGCPANPLLVHENMTLASISAFTLNAVGCAVVVALIVLMRKRWQRSTPAQRRGLGPVMLAGGLAFTGFATLFAAFVVTGSGSTGLQAVMYMAALVLFASVPFAFLTGFMRMKLSRADAVGQLLDWLATQRDRHLSLRDLMAEALRYPDLQVAYWLPERQRWTDAQGQPLELPGADSGKVTTPIESGGRPIAMFITDAELVEERLLIQAVGPALALTMENERLAAELRVRVEELRASRARIVRAGDDERRRLERDLHDGAQQRLVALALNLRLARASLESDPQGATELIDDAIQELTEATAELRELARGIHPAILTDRGLEAAVTALASRASVPVEVGELPDERLAAPVESTAYFVIAESLTNVARYAHATHAEVDVRRDNGKLVVEVRDDGVGGADPARGSGLRGLADRVGAVDGRIAVESPAGAGTTVRAEIPCER